MSARRLHGRAYLKKLSHRSMEGTNRIHPTARQYNVVVDGSIVGRVRKEYIPGAYKKSGLHIPSRCGEWVWQYWHYGRGEVVAERYTLGHMRTCLDRISVGAGP